ncbi:MAG TPA: Lrp/AsnC family transcriptional regulator [Clostridia bacterium]|jgi:DNA-binding Lrp family transcriptional regulator|nr:Lrp/AsnC family transcriptional regulator [Clostridia bacterium]
MEELKNKILKILRDDARLDAETVAAMLNEDVENVRRLIAELERTGVIVKYFTLVNEEKLGENYVEALIEVKVIPQKQNGFDAIAREIEKFPEVKSVYLMSGAYDLLVTIAGKNLKDIARFVAERLSPMENVQSTATHFILKKYKTEGVTFEGEDDGQRLKIQL